MVTAHREQPHAKAVPMLAMYVISIAVAWLAAPRKAAGPAVPPLRLVAAAAMLDQAWRCPNSAADSSSAG